MGRGGAEQMLLTLLGRIDPTEYDVDLLVLLGQGELRKKLPGSVRLLNTEYSETSVLSQKGRRVLAGTVFRDCVRHGALAKNIPYLVRNGMMMLKKRRFQADKFLWKIVSDASDAPKRRYDLAVAFLEGGAAYFVADHVRAKKKVAFIHVDYRMAGYTRELDHGCYAKMNRIFCVSEDNRKSFLKVYPELKDRTEVFYLSPDAGKVERKSLRPGGFSDDFEGIRVLTVARLVRQKRLDLSVEALRIYEEKRKNENRGLPEIRWYVLGEGDERKMLEEKIRGFHLEKKFVLLGVRDNPYPYFRQADLYVHCTGFEGRSIALQEAGILGKPRIASDCSGNRELIQNGRNGILVPLKAEKIEEAVAHLATHPQEAERLGQKARENAGGGDDVGRLLKYCGAAEIRRNK